MTREMLVSLLGDTLDATFCKGIAKQVSFLPKKKEANLFLCVHKGINDGKTHGSAFMFQSKSVPVMTVKQYFQRLRSASLPWVMQNPDFFFFL